MIAFILFIVAALFVWGAISQFLTGDWVGGVLLLILACAVGPGGWSIWR